MNNATSYYILLFCTVVLFSAVPSVGQVRAEESSILISTFTCKGTNIDSNIVDVYVVVPYHSLQFVKSGSQFGAQYSVRISLKDSTNNKVKDTLISRRIIETNYEVSRGSTGKFEALQSSFVVPPKSYKVDVVVQDAVSGRDISNSRKINSPMFKESVVSLSSIMVVSSIEQRGSTYAITPYFSDNVSTLTDGFFLFFELYPPKVNADSVKLVCELLDANNTRKYKGSMQSLLPSSSLLQRYMRVQLPANLAAGVYTLRVLALPNNSTDSYSASSALTTSSKTIVIERGVSSSALLDIHRSVRQLRYVATQTEIDTIEAATNVDDKQLRFENFWKEKDPSPNTIRNEAFEDYYTRIEYANKNFRSYNDGWLTDMGMVYIVLGPPTTTEQRMDSFNNRSAYIWNYPAKNRRFIFIDETGFGNFRLSTSTPFPYSEKYQYSPN